MLMYFLKGGAECSIVLSVYMNLELFFQTPSLDKCFFLPKNRIIIQGNILI